MSTEEAQRALRTVIYYHDRDGVCGPGLSTTASLGPMLA